MKRKSIRSGAAITIVAIVGFGGLAVAGSFARSSGARKPPADRIEGNWADPEGTCVGDVEYDPATEHYTCLGTSEMTGSLKGSTTWKIDWIFDSTGYVGTEREVFTGRVVGQGRGKLVLSEEWTMDFDGQNFRNQGPIVKSTGDLAGLHGRLTWKGSIDPSTGIGNGSYSGRFHTGRKGG